MGADGTGSGRDVGGMADMGRAEDEDDSDEAAPGLDSTLGRFLQILWGYNSHAVSS